MAPCSDKTITVEMLKDSSGAPKKGVVGPLTYREVNGQAHLKFVTDKDGNVDYFHLRRFHSGRAAAEDARPSS